MKYINRHRSIAVGHIANINRTSAKINNKTVNLEDYARKWISFRRLLITYLLITWIETCILILMIIDFSLILQSMAQIHVTSHASGPLLEIFLFFSNLLLHNQKNWWLGLGHLKCLLETCFIIPIPIIASFDCVIPN